MILEKDGYITYKNIHVPFLPHRDIFSLFDIVAKRRAETRYIQVKASKHLSPSKERLLAGFEAFAKERGQAGDTYEIWHRKPQGWHGRGKNKKFHRAKWEVNIIAVFSDEVEVEAGRYLDEETFDDDQEEYGGGVVV